MLAGRFAAALPRGGYLPGADDRAGFAQPHVGRGDGLGHPVIASRIGGLPYTVTDGVTGLLFEPGDPGDLARKIAQLLDDAELRRRIGLAGRKRFEDDFVWEDVIERYFRPLLAQRRVGSAHR